MSEPSIASPEALLGRTYRPWEPFPHQLHAFLHLTRHLTHSTHVRLCLPSPATTTTGDHLQTETPVHDHDPLISHSRHPSCSPCRHFQDAPHHHPLLAPPASAAPACPRLTDTTHSRLALPLTYQHTLLGVLALAAPHPHSPDDLHRAQWLAQHLTYQIKRHEFQQLARRHLGRDLRLIGISPALQQIDRFVEKAAAAPLPILLLGEPGTETTTVAAMLHLAGPHPTGPFVQVSGAALAPESFAAHLADSFSQAHGGTLFIQDIAALDLRLQTCLADLLTIGVAAGMKPPAATSQPRSG